VRQGIYTYFVGQTLVNGNLEDKEGDEWVTLAYTLRRQVMRLGGEWNLLRIVLFIGITGVEPAGSAIREFSLLRDTCTG
jgi:hypothetical protein